MSEIEWICCGYGEKNSKEVSVGGAQSKATGTGNKGAALGWSLAAITQLGGVTLSRMADSHKVASPYAFQYYVHKGSSLILCL